MTNDNLITSPPEDNLPLRFFAILVENEYVGKFGIPEAVSMEGVIAGLDSDPRIIPISIDAEILVGSIWNGTSFQPPQ